jgi:hypothetical protein
MIDEQDQEIREQLKALSSQVKTEDVLPLEAMKFICLQQHLRIATVNTKLVAHNADQSYRVVQLSLRLERLTKWLIALTIVLGLFAVPLAIDVVLKWLK